jgi:hypothetical protein
VKQKCPIAHAGRAGCGRLEPPDWHTALLTGHRLPNRLQKPPPHSSTPASRPCCGAFPRGRPSQATGQSDRCVGRCDARFASLNAVPSGKANPTVDIALHWPAQARVSQPFLTRLLTPVRIPHSRVSNTQVTALRRVGLDIGAGSTQSRRASQAALQPVPRTQCSGRSLRDGRCRAGLAAVAVLVWLGMLCVVGV